MVGMKVGYGVISLVPIHVDHDSVERADTRHGMTITRLRIPGARGLLLSTFAAIPFVLLIPLTGPGPRLAFYITLARGLHRHRRRQRHRRLPAVLLSARNVRQSHRDHAIPDLQGQSPRRAARRHPRHLARQPPRTVDPAQRAHSVRHTAAHPCLHRPPEPARHGPSRLTGQVGNTASSSSSAWYERAGTR